MSGRPRFPFSAVVGADEVKLALLLAALDPGIGGVLLRGDKGSAKTTLARGLAALLPGAAPFVDLPVGATEDRLVGSLDLTAALTGGEVRLRPGLLADANGGVLYVDEVNLLPDHLVDALLDVAASGVNRVEREGVAAAHPARFVLIGSMNPEEGELRPQLLDRFGLCVDVGASPDPAVRAAAVRRRLAFDADPTAATTDWAGAERALADRLAAAVAGCPARLPGRLVESVSTLCVAVGAEGLRADLVICRSAAALARWEGRNEAGEDDVRRVASLALAHRGRRRPLDPHGVDGERLADALDEAFEGNVADPPPTLPPVFDPHPAGPDPAAPAPTRQPGAGPANPDPAGGGGPDPGAGPDDRDPATAEPGAATGAGRSNPPGGRGAAAVGERVVQPDAVAPMVRLDAPAGPGRHPRSAPAGRRSLTEGARGRLVGDRAPGPSGPAGVAVAATVREAAARRAREPRGTREQGRVGDGPLVRPDDVREAVREHRTGNLVIMAVDASGSMGVDRRMEAAKGAVLSLLVDAYQRRDRLSLVTFRDEGATVVLRPTGSVEVARARLTALATGGRTPLAAGISAALDVAASAAAHRPLLVLVTDGRATAAPAGQDPLAAARAAAGMVRRRGVPAVVVDVEHGSLRLGLAAELAAAMGARILTVDELSARHLTAAVRGALELPPA